MKYLMRMMGGMMSDIKWIYLVGPLRGNFFKKLLNIYRAKKAASKIWNHKIAVFVPHINSGWIDSPETDEFVLPANIDMINRCDAIFVLGKWYKSRGSIAEIKYAYKNAIPIYFSLQMLLHDCENNSLVKPADKINDALRGL